MQKGKINKEIIVDAVVKAKEGDSDAFNFIYSELFAPLFRYVYFRVNRKEEAEDLTQVVFLKIWSALPGFDVKSGGQFYSWCFSIARNSIMDFWKKKKEVLLEEIKIQPSGEENIANLIDDKKVGEAVKKAILSLNEEQQDIMVLKFINELSNKEIAETLGKSEEAVRQAQSRALKELKVSMRIYE